MKLLKFTVMNHSLTKYIRLSIYCFFMRRLWWAGYRLYNWAEDRRPGGGFYPENYY